MNNILANIRAVKGVIGTIVVDKNRSLTYELMPASYTTDDIKRIALPLLHFGKSLTKNMSMDFFFEKGAARIYNREKQIIIIIGQPELNLNTLGFVCREAVHAISRKLTHQKSGVKTETVSSLPDVGTEFLINAINIISSNCVEKIGAYMATKYLRQAKDELVSTYPLLSSLTVDNNSIVSVIKGLSAKSDEETLTAFAHWANLFLSSAAKATNKLKPADIMELTFEIKDKLQISGFYQLYADLGV
ncbi:MAG: hypothetical protein J7K40_11295 [candidate division Zixibacteria bacterium]|nr:hypothetical protein [candidate division Zixibacteria bacterium]